MNKRRNSNKTLDRPKLVYLAHEVCGNCGSGWARIWNNGQRRCGSCGRKRVLRRRQVVAHVSIPKVAETSGVGAQ